MKKWAGLFYFAALLFFTGSAAWGAVHSAARAKTDTWYSVTPDRPFMELYYADYDLGDYAAPHSINLQLYQNEQTFLTYGNYNYEMDMTSWACSYLFDFGGFWGLSMINFPAESLTIFQYSPGFRMELDDQKSYIAASVNFVILSAPHDVFESINSYEIEGKYYTDQMKLGWDIVIPQEGNSTVDISGAFQAARDLVVGGEIASVESDLLVQAGITYNPGSWIVDAQAGKSGSADMSVSLSGMYRFFDDFYAGAGAVRQGSGAANVTLKARYNTGRSAFLFQYLIHNETNPARISLCYQMIF